MTTTTLSISKTADTSRRTLARTTVYPTILLANAGLVVWAVLADLSLAGITMAGLLGSIAVLTALEQIMPYRAEWNPDWKEGLRDFFYFGLNGGVDAVVKLGIAFGVSLLGLWNNGLPLWVALPAAILIVEFAGYWMHRFGHAGWLWKVHGVHHTPDKVNTWNNNTIHFLNSAYSGLAKTLPLLVLGFGPEVIIIAAFASTLQSFAVHANIDVELVRLGTVIMGPAHHRLHHSTVIEEAGNFASAITLWDIVFGTFVYGEGRAPAEVGVERPTSFPAPLDVARNQLHPFIDQARN